MTQIIRNRIILITGDPGHGKSFVAVMMASCYERIYSNINITGANGRQINNVIKSVADLQEMEFDPVKGVVILDEGGVNVNARNSMSEENKIYGELGMLGRKLNVDIIIIGQLKRMVDVYFRELATYTFEMNSWFEKKDYLMFEAKIYGKGESIVKISRFDLFEFSRLTGITYNTLESSRIDKKTKKDTREKKVLVSGEAAKNDFVTGYAPLWSTEADKIIGRTHENHAIA